MELETMELDHILDEVSAKIKKMVKDITVSTPEDWILYSMLKVSNMDQVKARNLLKQCVDFKLRFTKLNDLEFKSCTVAQEVTDDILVKAIGTDYEGRLVIWAPLGRWNARKLIEKGLRIEIFKFIFRQAEAYSRQLYEMGLKEGRTVKAVAILDLKELTLWKMSHYETLQVALDCVRLSDVLFPLVDKVYVVNAHWVSNYLFGLVKHIISTSNIGKIEIMNAGDRKCLEVLKTKIPLNVIPIEYGGLGPKVLAGSL